MPQRRRRTHLKQAQPAEPTRETVGEGVRQGRCLHYEAFKIDDDLFQIGDCIHLKNPDPDAEPFLAQIQDVLIWDESPNDISILGQWFYRPSDITVPRMPALLPSEVFYTVDMDENDVSSVDGKVIVRFGSPSDRRLGHAENDDEDEDNEEDENITQYICRKTYNLKQQKLVPYKKMSQFELDLKKAELLPHLESENEEEDDDTDGSDDVISVLGKESGTSSSSEEEEDDDDDDEDEVPRKRPKKAQPTPVAKRRGRPRKSDTSPVVKRPRGRPRKSASATPTTSTKEKEVRKTPKKAPRTPKTPKKTPNRTPTGTPTSRGRRRRGRLSLTVTKSGTQAADTTSAMSAAKQKLALSVLGHASEALPCREVEFYEMLSFVMSKLESHTSGCMFVSGVPGTGKTASIRAMSADLRKQQPAASFKFVEINAMALTSPQQAYSELWRHLTDDYDSMITPSQACDCLRKQFTTPVSSKESVVLLLDEVDYLYTRKQDVLYNFFDWPSHAHSHLILVAVANTMDLPERVMAHRVSSRIGLTRLTFAPYTKDQLIAILKHRLPDSSLFEDVAIELCARKVSAVSGDARRAMSACSRAAEIGLGELGQSQVTIKNISDALNEMSRSPIIDAIERAAQHEKIFLLALLVCFRQRGIEEAIFSQVLQEHSKLCNVYGIVPPTPSALAMICAALGACRILLVEPGRQDMMKKIRANCSQDDILFALRDDAMAKHVAKTTTTTTTTHAHVAEEAAQPQFDD